jgi:4-alpha-glucanotransferase
MKADGYKWWRDRMAAMFELYDGVRIDHFRAFDTYYDIPASAATAKEGKWRRGPGYPLVKALQEVADGRLLIAEDLGDLTPGVHKLMARAKLPGMRIFEFAFDEPDSPYLPHNYVENCVAYTGTHDNDTLLGFIWSLDEAKRSHILDYCHHNPHDWDNGYDDIFRSLLGSSANLVIFPMQDILRYGSDCRMNTPGTPSGNWEWRVMQWQIDSVDTGKYRYMLDLYCRLPIVEVE